MEKNLALWWNTFYIYTSFHDFWGRMLAELMGTTPFTGIALAMTRFFGSEC